MPVSSQACPKCDPHLITSAGLSSLQQGIPLEPAFTRKKRVPEQSKKVTFLSTYPTLSHSATSEKGNDKAARHKAGYRRANTSHPTSYQTHFCQPWPGQGGHRAPVVRAAGQLEKRMRSPPPPAADRMGPRHHSPECPVSKSRRKGGTKLVGKGGHTDKERTVVDKDMVSHGDDPPVRHASPELHEGVKIERRPAPKCRRPLFVDPLPIPIADNDGNKRNGSVAKKAKMMASEQKGVDKDMMKAGRVERNEKQREAVRSVPSNQSKLDQRGGGVSKKAAGKTAGDRRRRRCYESPLKKLYEDDRARHARAMGIFETEYRKHYKDWVGQMCREHRDKRVSPPPATYGGPPVLTDPSDPRLLKHSPPPVLPDHAPESHWVTQYKLHYAEPTTYHYHKGAFRRGRHDDKENVLPVEDSEAPPPGDVADGDDSDLGGHDPSGMSWFDQLVELRRKADHYKWQSERTNFQPHYLVTLRDSASDEHMADRDTSGSISSVSGPQADSERGSSSPVVNQRLGTIPKERDTGVGRKDGRKVLSRGTHEDRWEIQDMESEDELAVPAKKKGSNKNGRHEKKGSAKHKHTYSSLAPHVDLKEDKEEDAECTCNAENIPQLSEESELDDMDGRIPTSELRRKAPFNVRHHLDRTTPYLVSPPKGLRTTSSSPSPVREDVRPGNIEEPVLLPRKCSNEVLGAGGRDLPRHISGRSSPFHADCIPKVDGHSPSASRSRSQTPPISRKGTQASRRPQGGSGIVKPVGTMSVTRPGTDSCKVCGSSLKPQVPKPLERSMEKAFATFPGNKAAKGKDYVVPVTVAAQPCGKYGRLCDEQADSHSIHRSLHLSQHKSRQQLDNIRAKMKQSEPLSKPHPSHTYQQRDYEPTSYRSSPDEEADHLSLSPLSLSSCSVASDILERAKKRRDQFWAGQRQPCE